MLRLYPVVRFVIVSGSKGKMLDVPALGALTTFLGGWGTCERALHADKEHGGSDWFTVRHGSEARGLPATSGGSSPQVVVPAT